MRAGGSDRAARQVCDYPQRQPHGDKQPLGAGMDEPQQRRPALHRADRAQQNGFLESFNGWLRDGRLNEEVFGSLAEARAVMEPWRLC